MAYKNMGRENQHNVATTSDAHIDTKMTRATFMNNSRKVTVGGDKFKEQ